MKYELINKDNLDEAIRIQHEIFPLENGSEDLKESVTQILPERLILQNHWLAKVHNKYVGICGLYAYKFAPKDAWLGWFGIVENKRRKGYGTEMLKFSMQEAKQRGFETIRLYTDKEDNAYAICLYNKFNMVSEIYNNPEDVHFEISKTLIFSKSLSNDPTILWNNQHLHLNDHDELNKNN